MLDDLYIQEGPAARPGSPAVLEAESYTRPLAVQTAYSYAVTAIDSARDHLEAVDLIVHLGQPSVAQWTSLRGLLEAASIASWLFNPGIDAHERISRSFSLRFTTLTQQKKIFVAVGDTAAVAKIDSRLNDIENTAVSLGFTKIRNKKAIRDGIGQRKPPISDLAESEFDLRNVYRFLSSVAHCDSAVIAQMGFKNITDDDNGQALLKRDFSPEQLELVLANAIILYARPLWMRTIQYGFDRRCVTEALERAYDQMKLTDTELVRFWRRNLNSGSAQVD